MSTPEERVNQKVEQLKAYKDAQGVDRTQMLTVKQRDEALHNQITGNVPPATAEEQVKVDSALKKAEKTVKDRQASGMPDYDYLNKVARDAADPANKGNQQLKLAEALRRSIPGIQVTEEPAEEQLGPVQPPPVGTNAQPGNTVGGNISELALKAAAEAGPKSVAGLPPGYKEGVTPEGQQLVTQPRQYVNVEAEPPAPGKGGLWGEPAPVEPAPEIKEPGAGRTALAALGAFLPGVGGFMMEPYARAQKDYLAKTERDKELTTLFWNEMKDDPITAKRFSRIPAVRDALQRNFGMTGDEILDLDKSISKDTAMGAQQFFDLLKTGAYSGPSTIQTPFGQIERKQEIKEAGGVPYKYNEEKNEWQPEQTEMMKRYNDLKDAYITGGYPPHLATLYAQKALKGQPIWNSIDMGNGALVMRNDVTGGVQTFKIDEAVKNDMAVEMLEEPFTKRPYGAFIYPKSGQFTLDDTQMLLFKNMRDKNGNPVGPEAERMYAEAVKSGDSKSYWDYIKGLFSGMDVTNHSTVGESEAEYNKIMQKQAQSDQQAADEKADRPLARVSPPPAAARRDDAESKKVKELLNTAVGDI